MPNKLFDNLKIKKYLVFILISIIILVGLILTGAYYLNNYLYNFIQKETVLNEKVNLEISANTIKENLINIENLLKQISTIEEIKNTNTNTCNLKLQEISKLILVPIKNLSRVNNEGIFYCSINPNAIGIDGNRYDYIRELIQTKSTEAVLGNLIINTNKEGIKEKILAFHIPIFDKTNFLGTLGGAFEIKNILHSLDLNIETHFKYPTAIVDYNGDILFANNTLIESDNIYNQEIKHIYSKNNIAIIENTQINNLSEYETTINQQKYIVIYFKSEIKANRPLYFMSFIPESAIKSHYSLTTKVIIISTITLIVILISIFLLTLRIIKTWTNYANKTTLELLSEADKNNQHNEELENLYTKVFYNSPLGLAIISLEGKFINVNHSMAEMLGYTIIELKEKSLAQITEKEDLKKENENKLKLINDSNNKFYKMTKRHLTKHGDTVWTLTNTSLIKDQNSNPKYFFSQIENITKQIEQDKKLNEKIIELEKLNKILIDRELTFKDLKDKFKKDVKD